MRLGSTRPPAGSLPAVDAPIGDVWRVGALAGYSRTSFQADAVASSGSSDSYHAGLYGGAQWSQIGSRPRLRL